MRTPRPGDENTTKLIQAVQTNVLRQALEAVAESASQQEQVARDAAFRYFEGGEKVEGHAQAARLALAKREGLRSVEMKIKTIQFSGEVPGMKP